MNFKICLLMYCSVMVFLMCIFGIMSIPNKIFAGVLTICAFTGMLMLAFDGCFIKIEEVDR